MKTFEFALALFLVAFAAGVMADNSSGAAAMRSPQGPGNAGQQRNDPPPQAYNECKGKTEGEVIQLTFPSGEKISATCVSSPKGLYARPERLPNPPGSPQQTRQFQQGGQFQQGVQPQPGNPPQEGRQPQVHNDPPPRAYEACLNKKEGDAVEISIASGEKLTAKCTQSPRGLFARLEHPTR